MENLLAFIEFTQFRQYVIDNYGERMVTDEEYQHITFPENIPLSEILEEKQDDDFLKDIKIKGRKIYKKYISLGSEFEINISYEARGGVIGVMDNEEMLLKNDNIGVTDLMQIFDSARIEILQLLLPAMYRFRSEPDFEHQGLI